MSGRATVSQATFGDAASGLTVDHLLMKDASAGAFDVIEAVGT